MTARFARVESSRSGVVHRWCGMLPRGDVMEFDAFRVLRAGECLGRCLALGWRSLRCFRFAALRAVKW